MAIRNIREYGDEVLTKTCKEVKEMTPRIRELIEDMLETMYDANGVGLAAPQVGILKRVVVIDVSEEGTEPYILINPRIVESSGEQTGQEGCLSLPGKSGQVTRPNYVKVVALDVNMKPIEVEGQELLARALCAASKILLLDEPVTGLDPKAMTEFYQLIASLNDEGIAVIMVSHDLHAAIKYATHILHVEPEDSFFGTKEEYLESDEWKQMKEAGGVKRG